MGDSWEDNLISSWSEPYHGNRKIFQKSDFKRKQIILELNSIFIVKYSKAFPNNDDKFNHEWFLIGETNVKDFLWLK